MADGRRRACDMASDNGRNGRNGSQRPGAGSGENGGNGKDASHEPNVGADGNGGNGGGESGAAESEGPAELLGEVRAIRRKARLARHAYWFPLVLFGLLATASVPFYIQHFPSGSGTVSDLGTPGPPFLQNGYLG